MCSSCCRFFLHCYERDFMLSLLDKNQTDIIEAFNSTSWYLDDLLNIDNHYFEHMVGQIYPTELQLNKVNSSDTEAPFLELMSWSTSELRVILAPWNWFKRCSKILLLTVPRRYFLWIICVIYVLFFHAFASPLLPYGHLLGKGWPLDTCL